MPDGLTLRSTLLLAALAFGLTFAIQALAGGGGTSAVKPATRSAPEPVADAPGAEPDLRLAAAKAVPALRNPRKPPKRRVRKPARKPARKSPPRPAPVMAAPTAEPTPTPAPRYIPPAPRYIPPAPRQPTPKPPAPKPTPAPTSPPPSGEFDTTGDS